MRTLIRLSFVGAIPIAVLAVALLAGCGDDPAGVEPDKTSGAPPVRRGIEGSGRKLLRVIGPVDRFGSVYVNGIRYVTSAALLSSEGHLLDESALRIGQIVAIEAERDVGSLEGVAQAVDLPVSLRGCVESVQGSQRSFTLLGRAVQVDDFTTLDPSFQGQGLAAISSGTPVTVSGIDEGAAQLRASRIDRIADCSANVARGIAESVNPTARTFELGSLTVNYSQATQLDIPANGLAAGSIAIARGSMVNGVLYAVSVSQSSASTAPTEMELTALVTAAAEQGQFQLGDIAVTAAGAAALAAAQGLEPGERVTVEGQLAAGTLTATRIERLPAVSHAFEGAVESIAADGSFTVLGIASATHTRTRFEDASTVSDRLFHASRLNVGDRVTVRGASTGSRQLDAWWVERADGDDDVSEAALRGPIERLFTGGFSILGVDIRVTRATEFDDISGPLAIGREIQVEGRFDGRQIIATEIEAVGDQDD